MAAAGEKIDAGTQRDDALFAALGKSKKRKRRKVVFTVISILLVIAIVAVVGVSFLQRRVREQFASSGGEVEAYAVSTGSISTVVSGFGSLTDVDLESITVPEGVEITEVLVKKNQSVQEGDILATLNMASVISAMADLQAEIESLDKQIGNAKEETASDVIYAGVSGRVKVLYAEEAADVTDVMFEHGALALISLDGYMALDIETDQLTAGQTVTVKRANEKEISGTVETVVGGKAGGSMSDVVVGAFVTVTLNGKGQPTNVLVTSNSGFGGSFWPIG